MDTLLAQMARPHLHAIVEQAFQHPQGSSASAVVIADRQCVLSRALGTAYRECLPTAQHLDFEDTEPAQLLAALFAVQAGDLVVLVQSTSFRLTEFRLRMELFKRGLKVIEHVHLARMTDSEAPLYIDSLAYDPAYLHATGFQLKERLDRAQGGRLETGETLYLSGPFENAMHNVGEYSDRKNFGGQFPIGEVFTEAKSLESVHGRVRIFAYGNMDFCVVAPTLPITLIVQAGRVVGTENSTSEFDGILDSIRAAENEIWVRELGFGLNKAFTRERRVTDIGTYERMCGIHFSLGAKHPAYPKPQFSRRQTRYHVDVFAYTRAFFIDEICVYEHGRWNLTSQQGQRPL